jgi:cytochrome b561
MSDALDAMSLAQERYSRVAMWFHWIIAALIIANLFVGGLHDDFGDANARAIMFWHKSLGMTVLGLSIARLFWRIGHRPPAFDPVMAGWEVALARFVHAAFYLLMIGLPLSGWLVVSTAGRPTDFFGLFSIPPLPVPHEEDLHELSEEIHELIAYAMIALVALHVAGALKHHLQGHRHLIGRMGPWFYRRP